MPRMRRVHASSNTRAGCERQARCGRDFLERERIELRYDLALEPRLVALAVGGRPLKNLRGLAKCHRNRVVYSISCIAHK